MTPYSASAQQGRAYLLRPYNDLDVFVEDVACQNMYVRLINRMLDGHGEISKVFPLGGRKNVIEACKSKQVENGRKRIYIIDADHDLMLKRRAPRLKNLYRLRKYCSENLLLSEIAIRGVAGECATSATADQLAALIRCEEVIAQATESLLPLFILYAVVAHFDLPIETVRFSVIRLLDDQANPESLSESKIRARTISILRRVSGVVDSNDYRKLRDTVIRRIARLDQGAKADMISGKTYLLPLIHLHLAKEVKLRDSIDSLKVRLANTCELDSDSGLRGALIEAVS